MKLEALTDEALETVDLYISQERWIQALNVVNRVLTLEPNNQDALLKKEGIARNIGNLSTDHAQKGVAFYKQGKFGPAETEFKMALNLDRRNSTANEYLEKIKSEKKEVSGEDIDELYMKGITAYTQENYQTAVFYWQRILEIDPAHVNAKRNLARAEEKLKIYRK